MYQLVRQMYAEICRSDLSSFQNINWLEIRIPVEQLHYFIVELKRLEKKSLQVKNIKQRQSPRGVLQKRRS